MDGWCVLRMAAPRTLRVTVSLAEAGFEVWTPVLDELRRVPRTKRFRAVKVPLLPTIVFAPYVDVPELLAILADPRPRHPPFRMFRHDNTYPKVPDRQLEALREIERRAAETAAVHARRMRPQARFTKGQPVHAPHGPFAGLEGEVIREGKGKEDVVTVVFPGFKLPVKIPSWHLESLRGSGTQPEHGTAARAA